jgi:hypothetical protein
VLDCAYRIARTSSHLETFDIHGIRPWTMLYPKAVSGKM